MSQRMKEWLATIPVELRAKMIEMHTGSNLPYILKKTYTTPADQLPKFKARIAIGLDKASRGQLDFRDMIVGGRSIDWDYVRKEVSRRPADIVNTPSQSSAVPPSEVFY